MLYQAGSLFQRAADGTLYYARPSAITISSETTQLEALGFPAGDAANTIQVLDSAVGIERYTLTLSQQSINDMDLQVLLDARSQAATSFTVPRVKIVTVPASTPYTVTLTEMSSALADADVSAVVADESTPQPLTRVAAAGSPTNGQFTVSAAKLITFNSAQAGKTVFLYFFETVATGKVIGGSQLRNQFGSMEFLGILKGTRIHKKFWLPSISRVSGINLGVTGNVETAELEYRINTPTGYNFPMLIWDVV
jgi:hypothetical protein